MFNQAYYYTNYCVFSVIKCIYKGCCIVFKDFMSLVKPDQIWSAYYCKFCHVVFIIRAASLLLFNTNYCVLALENVIIRIENIVFRDFMTLVE